MRDYLGLAHAGNRKLAAVVREIRASFDFGKDTGINQWGISIQPPIARFEPNEHIRILLVAAPAVRKAYQAIAEEVGNRPKVDVFIVADVESEILDSVEGVHGLVGCPRSLFSEELLGKNGNKLQWLHVGGAGVEEFLDLTGRQ